jgi:hypothetical protein
LGNALVDLLDVLLESLVQHLVGFVQNEHLEIVQLELSSLLEILDSSWGSNNHLDSVLKGSDLVINVTLAINTLDPKLVGTASKSLKLIRDLNGQLSGGNQDQNQRQLTSLSLESSLGSESLQSWQTEGQSLTTSGSIFSKDVLAREDQRVGFLLNRKEVLNASGDECFLHVFRYSEVVKVSQGDIGILFLLGTIFILKWSFS